MQTFQVTLTITCEDAEQAHQVIAERTGYDEDYGFTYTIEVENDMKEIG